MPRFDTTSYRYANEQIILFVTIILVLLVIALTATATVCLSVVFIIAALVMSYYFSRAHHQSLIEKATPVTQETVPGLIPILGESAARLQVEPLNVFVVHANEMNAYTFGLSSPKAIVLFDSLFKTMDRDEIQFIIGHEMGHVKLGHTWLNSLVGGMAGIPASSSASLILELAFRWWNRTCEYSADRAGMLACGNPNKAISALVKLEAGPGRASPQALAHAMERIEAEDDNLMGTLGEALATHPLIINRIEKIQKYAKSGEYARLQPRMNANLGR
jgi:Zn-dependent protease with chaperone function